MLRSIFTMTKVVLHVQSRGKSMQGGVVAAYISVKVTVDFCCAVPFLISIATIVPALSPSISVLLLSLSLSFTYSHSSTSISARTHTLLGKTQIWFLVLVSSLHFDSVLTVMSGSVPGRHLPSLTARTLQQPSNKEQQLPKSYIKNQTAVLLYSSLTKFISTSN